MLPTALSVIVVATAPPTAFPGTPLVIRGATAGDFADAAKAAGVPVDLGPLARSTALPGLSGKALSFWESAEHAARVTGTRIECRGDTGALKFLGGPRPPVRASTHGAFRVAAKTVTAVNDLDSGTTTYDLDLDLAWEPRYAVFRTSAGPKILKAIDDRGTAVTAAFAAVKGATSGFRHCGSARLSGVTRESKQLKSVSGEFLVTASQKWLSFEFAKPGDQTAGDVTVRLASFGQVEDRWEATFDLHYPENGPVFESFEADVWLSSNRATLKVAGKDYSPVNYELTERGRGTRAVYRFRGVPAGAKDYILSYATPSPPVEFAVPFTLSDIPLP